MLGINYRLSRMKKLQTYLDLYRISQTELTHRMDVSQPSVWAWLHGEGMPSIDNLRKLSEITGLSVADLIAQESDEAAA